MHLFNFKNKDPDAIKSLYGAILLKFGLGGIMTWGQLSIYFISYYYHLDKQTNLEQATIIFNIATFPIAIFMILSVKIAEKYTYKKLIYLAALLYPITTYCSIYAPNLIMFQIIYITFAISAFALIALPIINCLWSHFPEDSGKVTGIAFFANGISTFVFSVLGAYLINPENELASVKYNVQQDGEATLLLFDSQVTQNVPQTIAILAFIYAIFTIPGACLISHETEINSNKIEANLLEQIPSQENARKSQLKSTINQLQRRNSYLEIEDMVNSSGIHSNLRKSIINQNLKQMNKYEPENIIQEQNSFQDYESNHTVKSALKSKPFIIIFTISSCFALFSFYLNVNFKTFLIKEINDDHFLTYIGSLAILMASVSNIGWGILGDKYPFTTLYKILVYTMTFIIITYGLFAQNKILFSISTISYHILNAGFMTLAGPALIGYFGVEIGQKLLPFKSLAMFVALLIIPIFNYITIQYGIFFEILFFIGIINLLSVYLVTILQPIQQYREIQLSKQVESNQIELN